SEAGPRPAPPGSRCLTIANQPPRPQAAGLPARGSRMPTISLAPMWHQHQPYYPDDVAGENPMPWVRLHGTKDYIGMALHLEEVPAFRCTHNLVHSLLVQHDA